MVIESSRAIAEVAREIQVNEGTLGRRLVSGQDGLTCDSLLAARLVTADGSVLEVREEPEPDLLWGLRGRGGNIGVVTEFSCGCIPVPVPMHAGMVIHPLADQARLSAFQGDVETGQSSPVELSIKVTRSSRVSSGNTS